MVVEQPIEDWSALPWRTLERVVYRLQKRIYHASARGNVQAVHSLQRLLMKSKAARCLAVRRVTQDNQGKNTAGVDGIKSVSAAHRPILVTLLRTPQAIKPQPVRRVWIPKPGKAEKRPLGIPTMLNRAHQTLARLALEPEWEAVFEPNSHGFRPGRSVHDAIAALFSVTCKKEKYILDADIAGCFDGIAQGPLLAKLNTYPALRRTIKSWFTAGVLNDGTWEPTTTGAPQGGPLSPLMANIALHGLETALRATVTAGERPFVVRYADDFVVLHSTYEGITTAKAEAEQWLSTIGLHLKASKTRITHTHRSIDGPAGCDFLGFHLRQYPVGKTHARRTGRSKTPLAYKVLTTPSKEAVQRHQYALRLIVRTHRAAPQAALIAALNPVITGWATYYRAVIAKRTFASCDYHLTGMLIRWADRRHPHKTWQWRIRKYWSTTERGRRMFKAPDSPCLRLHADTAIRRHVKVRGTASPFDGNLLYWAKRLHDHPLTTSRTALLLRRQGGGCAWCGLLFTEHAHMEVDHHIPRSRGGTDDLNNLRLLHRHCHDQKTVQDGSCTPPGP